MYSIGQILHCALRQRDFVCVCVLFLKHTCPLSKNTSHREHNHIGVVPFHRHFALDHSSRNRGIFIVEGRPLMSEATNPATSNMQEGIPNMHAEGNRVAEILKEAKVRELPFPFSTARLSDFACLPCSQPLPPFSFFSWSRCFFLAVASAATRPWIFHHAFAWPFA